MNSFDCLIHLEPTETLKLSSYFIFSNRKERCKVPIYIYIPFSENRAFWMESLDKYFDKILPEAFPYSINKSFHPNTVKDNYIELGKEFQNTLVFYEPFKVDKV